MIKKLLVVLAFAAIGTAFYGPRPAYAAAPPNSISQFELGVGTGTTITQVTTSSGFLYDIVLSSGAAGDYAVCWDSGSVTGIALTSDGTSSAPRFPTVFVTATNTTSSYPAHVPPIGFSNGLVCASSAAGRRVNILYRTPL